MSEKRQINRQYKQSPNIFNTFLPHERRNGKGNLKVSADSVDFDVNKVTVRDNPIHPRIDSHWFAFA